MNRPLRTAVALLTLAGASSVFAQSMGLSGDALYARYHKAESTAAAATARPAPGPNAQQLIYLGVDPTKAIEQARAQGESPRATSAEPQAPLAVGGYDLYARNAMAAAASQGMRQAMR